MATRVGSPVVEELPGNATEADIQQYYERTEIDRIHDELTAHGIDPTPTISSVRKLVEQSKHTRDPKRR